MSSHVISQPLHTCKRTNTHIHTTSQELIAGYERSSVHAPRDGIQTNTWCCHTRKKMNQHWCWHESSCYCNLLKTKHVSSPNHASNMNKKANTQKYILFSFMYYMHFGPMQTSQVWVIDIPLNTVTHHLHSCVFQTVRITLQSGKSTSVILRSLCLIDASVRTD